MKTGTIRSLLTICIPLLALVQNGCDDTTAPCPYANPAVRLEGTIRSAEPLEKTMVVAERVDVEGLSKFFGEVGEDGGFALDVPTGRYVLEVEVGSSTRRYPYRDGGLVLQDEIPDTLTFASRSEPYRFEFGLGSVAVTVDAPDGAWRYISVDLKAGEPETWTSWESTVDGMGDSFEDGRAEVVFPGIPPGEYAVRIGLPIEGYVDAVPQNKVKVWLPGAHDAAEAGSYAIEPGAHLALSLDLTSTTAWCEGSVGGAWLEFGLSTRPEVALVGLDGDPIAGAEAAEGTGAFSVPLAIPESVKVVVASDGVDRWYGGTCFEDAHVFEPGPGETIDGIDLEQCGLRLVCADPLMEMYAASVEIYDATGTELRSRMEYPVLDDETLLLPNLWPGEHLIRIAPREYSRGETVWRPQWFDRATDAVGAAPVVFAEEGEILTLDLVLEEGGVIRGEALGGSPEDIFPTFVITLENDPALWGYLRNFDSTWGFEFTGLPGGGFKVGYIPPNAIWIGDDLPLETVWHPGASDWDTAVVVEIVDAATVEGVDIDVP